MKWLASYLLVAAASLWIGVAAHAANVTLTPVIGPTETGENSAPAQQVMDMARMKPGSCTVSIAAAGSGTCNGAAGAITVTSVSMAVTTGSAAVTVANSKVQAGDFVQCTVDATGATANSIPFCASATVSAQQIIFKLANVGSATESANLTMYFLVFTQGNPN